MPEQILHDRFPSTAELKDGSKVTLRPLQADDEEELYRFFQLLSDQDRLPLKDDVSRREVIHRWCQKINYFRILPLIAFKEGRVIADATLHMNASGWMRHVGHVRVVVAPDERRKGLASCLVDELSTIASDAGLWKLDAEIMETQEEAIRVFEKIGFHQIAVLPRHVLDLRGTPHDLIIFAKDLRRETVDDFFAGD